MRLTGVALLLATVVGCGERVGPRTVESSAPVFNEDEINDFEFTMAPADWDTIVYNPEVGGAQYFPATLRWKGEVLEQVGVQSTADLVAQQGSQKMSLQLKFNEFAPGQHFHGLIRLKLRSLFNDPSMMRERISFAVFQTRMPAPRACHARVFVNGDLKGLYEVNEKIDKTYAKSRYAPGAPVGDLYHVWDTPYDDPVDPYLYLGPDPNSYIPYPWAPRTNDDADDLTPYDPARLVHFLDVINNAPAFAGSVCDLDALLELLAVEAAIANPHGLVQDRRPDGHWQYCRPDTGLFTLIPWNYPWAWDEVWSKRSIYHNFQNTRLAAVVEGDPLLRERYRQKIAEVIAGAMLPANAHARIEAVYAQIRPFVYEDPYKPFSNLEFEEAVAGLHRFVDQRYAYLQGQLAVP